MRYSQRSTKRVIAVFTLPLWLLAAGPAAYADRGGYQLSQGNARADHRSSSRPFNERSGRPLGTPPQRQTGVRRVPERRTVPANGQWNTSSLHRRDRFVPEHRRFVPERRPLPALPPRHQVVIHHGTPFHYFHGEWYRPYGPRFIPVAAPIGAVVHVLPAYHWRVWFYSVPFPYYYVNNVYYVQSSQGYMVAEPPPQQIIREEPVSATDGSAVTEEPADNGNLNQANADQLYVYPTQGQSQQQLERDRLECRSWAAGQTGYGMSSASAPSGDTIGNYERALSACLEGRGYTVR